MLKIPPLYVAFKKENKEKIPPKELTLTPKDITFKDKVNFSKFEDKCSDDTSIPRITCYHSIERAINILNGENKKSQNLYDIYQPNMNNDIYNGYYDYEYLINRGLIKSKKLLCRESWFIQPTTFSYVGTVKKNNKNEYDFVYKDYDISDISLNEGVVENFFVRNELKRKGITILFNASNKKERIIYPDKDNFGNRFKRKYQKSSYWFTTPEGAMLNYITNYLTMNGLLDKKDYFLIIDNNLNELFIKKELKESIMKELLNLSFFINIINVPDYKLFDIEELGYGWKLYDNSFSYNEEIEPDAIKEVNRYDFMNYISFRDEEGMKKAKTVKEVYNSKRNVSHGLIYKKGEKYRNG